ncbi:MAG: NAD-dependent epimerase/dehydratase family protein [Acidobacteria bacterium]|nr:NAD-dependent epimerase/dehydratase family protein [Acidobacteriota bacterium]
MSNNDEIRVREYRSERGERVHVLVIGGTRFIGAYVVRGLAARGHSVTVYHRGNTEADLPAGVRHVHAPSAGIPVLEFSRALLEPRPHVVIHMTAMGEEDARAAVQFFRGQTRRMLLVSSGDVYLAYGRLTGLEPGELEPVPLSENSRLRSVLYPYKAKAASQHALEVRYEKILAEREVLGDKRMGGTVLRLPKVYGPGENADFATVHRFRNHPKWRWTHGYVENVATAIALAALDERADGNIYNVGEERTPTVEERLRGLPGSDMPSDEQANFNFAQDIVYDTSKIRSQLGYREPVEYELGIRRTVVSTLQ